MTYFFSHTDLDGVGSFILNEYFNIQYDNSGVIDYHLVHNSNGEFVFHKYFKDPTPDDTVIIVDLAVIEDLYKFLCEKFPNFLWLDHHDDTGKYVEDKRVIYDSKSSGTMIYFNHLKSKFGLKRVSSKVNQMCQYIDTYDRFDDESPLWDIAQDMNRLFYKLYTWGQENPILATKRFINFQVDKLRDQEQDFYFNPYEQQKIEEAKEQEYTMYQKGLQTLKIKYDNRGQKFGVIAVPSKVSIVAYNILQERPDLIYLLIVNTYQGITGKLSFRGSKFHEVDGNCLEGFAGHTKAAGAGVSPEVAVKLLNDPEFTFEYDEKFLEGKR